MSGHDDEDTPKTPESEEKTAAFSLEDMGIDPDEGEATAALSLDELGLSEEPTGSSPPASEDAQEKTAALSLEDMGLAEAEEEQEPQSDEPQSDEEEEEADKTAAFSLEDMGLAEAEGEQEPQSVEPQSDEEEKEAEKTAAFSLEDMGLAEAEGEQEPQGDEPQSDEEEEEAEKTAAFSLEDMGIEAASEPSEGQPEGERGEEEDEAEKTAAFSLEDMGLAEAEEEQEPQSEEEEEGAEKTAAFSLEDMGIGAASEPSEGQPEGAADEVGAQHATSSQDEPGLEPKTEEDLVPPRGMDEQEEPAEKTAALSLEDMGLGDDPSDQGAHQAPDLIDGEESEDKTAAYSLEDMGIEAPEEPTHDPEEEDPTEDMSPVKVPSPKPVEEEDERTAALSPEDMGIGAEEDPTEAMSPVKPSSEQPEEPDEERTAALSLDALGDPGVEAHEERTVAMPAASDEPPAPPPPELQIRAGNDRGESFVVQGESVVVGRGLDCDIVLNDASISRRHFRLDKTSNGYRMVDLESGNGTKINGVRLSQFDLAHGSVIEAGTTTMAWKQLDKIAQAAEHKEGWDDNSESTRVSNLASVNVLPEWADQVKKEDQAKAVAAQRGPLKMIVMLLSIIIALVLGFVGLDKALNMGIVFDDGSAAEADLVAAESKREAIKLMNQGREAFSEREWSKAKKKFKAALEIDEEVGDGKRYLKKTKEEATAFKALRRGRAALDDAQYQEAISELSKIDDSSLYYSDDGEEGEGAVDLLAQAIDAFVEAKILESQRLDDAGDHAGALRAIEEALKRAPEDPSALAMKLELAENEADEAQTSESKASEARSVERKKRIASPQREAKRGVREAPRKPSKASSSMQEAAEEKREAAKSGAEKRTSSRAKKSSGMLSAMSAYARGDFSGAVTQFKALSKKGSRKSKAKAKRLADAVERFKTLYTPAMVAAKSFRSPSKTIKGLRAARKLDAAINGAYSGKIKKELARQLVHQANAAWSSKKYGKAGRHARQALALDPKHPQAKKIYAEVRAEAQGWFDQAKSAASSNPDKAMQLLSRVVSIFPRGDPRYKEAYKLLNQLAADEED